MKRITTSLLFLLLFLNILLLTVAQADTSENQQPDADFLEFLAEMDEVTGDGFETWLTETTSTDLTTNQHGTKYEDPYE